MKNIPTLLLLFCCGIISAQCPDFTNLAGSGVTCQYGSFNDPFQFTGIASGRHTIITQQGSDPYTGYQLPFLPSGESAVVKLGNELVGREAEAVTYQFTVNPDYAILLLKFAVVLEDPGHPAPAQPRFVVRVLNNAEQLVETCAEYDVTAAGDIPGFQTYTAGWYNVRWRPWTNVGIDLSDYAGQQIRLQFVTYDCDYWGHFGYAYFTASCMSNKLAMSGCNGSQVTLVAPSGFESYVWDNGSTSSSAIYTVNGTTTANCLITSATGCQFTLSGTISSQSGLPTTSTTVYDTICEGDTYMGHFFDLPAQWETGTHTRTRMMTTDGCSSNLTLQLKVNEPAASTFLATAHGSYTWNGVTYYESGDYTQHFNSVEGCDSVVTLHLTTTFELPLPDNVFDGDCVLPPEPNAFAMTELFSYPNVNSMSTPMVADMDGDGLPEVLACCYASGAPYYSAGFHVINGQTGELKYTLNTVQYVNSGQMVTIADVDYDGKSELFLLGSSDHKLYCYNYNGGVRWMSSNTLDNNYLLSAADVNNDGVAEIVCGKYVYDAQTGVLLLQGDMVETGMGFGAPHGVHMPYYHIPYYMYALGDVDGDGTLEVCAGNTIYKMVITNNAGTAGNSWSILRQAETPGINNKDGETFLVDFDNDGDFDVCVIGISHSIEVNTASHTLDVYVWDGQTSQLMAHTTVPVVGKWGASIPYSGDLNGDGYPEIIFAVTNIGMLAYTYDTVTHNFSEMHHYAPFGETAGFTVFDFNQDGQNEIVYRGATQLFIADGITLANLCPPVTALSGTIAEYPVVADVDADGHAEIVITRQGGGNGVVSVFGSAIPGAWSSARKVWNQWAYSSVNINEDMTVPQNRFNVATEFPNGEKPFNTFLHQMPYIDTQGNLFNPVTDVAVTGASASSQEDTVMLTLNCCNNGDMPLLPYPVTVYANAYGGNVITTVTVMESIPVDSCVQQVIRLPKSLLCEIQGLEALVVAVNNSGSGIAQNGGQQSECDTTNNTFTIPFQLQHVDPVELTVSACDSYEWNGQNYTQSGDYIASFPHPGGCDSVVTLHLTIEPTPNAIITSTADTICESGEVMLHAGLDASYGPVLHVPAVAVGDILCTDNSIVKPSNWPVAGKTAMGIVFYVDSTGVHGWAVHLQDQGADIRWSPNTNYTDVLTLANFSHPHNTITDMNGYSNTHNLRLAGDYTLFPAAYAVDFANGWYLPAAGQLRLLVAEVITMNNSLQIVNGMPFSMNSIWGYWSSTEADNLFAWQVNHLGNVTATDKNSTIQSKVRSVRNF